MPNLLEHRPRSRGKGKPQYCVSCGMRYPCLAAHQRSIAIAVARKNGHGLVPCRQCERLVDITQYVVDQGRCRGCVSAGALLSRHWKQQGIPIRG